MKGHPSFGRGVLVAAGITIIGTVATSFGALSLGISLMALAYLCHLLYHSPRTTGRVALFAAWLVGSVSLGLLDSNIGILLSFNLGSLWLARSWCHLDTILQALTDLGLWLSSLALAAAVILHSASLPLGIWTFLLIQALWPWVAQQTACWTLTEDNRSSTQNTQSSQSSGPTPKTAFDEAKGNAESALRRLQTQSETYHATK